MKMNVFHHHIAVSGTAGDDTLYLKVLIRFGLCFGIVSCVSPGFVLSLLTKALMSCFQPIAR